MIAYQIRKATIKLASLFIACLLSMASFAAIDVYDFDSVQQEAQYLLSRSDNFLILPFHLENFLINDLVFLNVADALPIANFIE